MNNQDIIDRFTKEAEEIYNEIPSARIAEACQTLGGLFTPLALQVITNGVRKSLIKAHVKASIKAWNERGEHASVNTKMLYHDGFAKTDKPVGYFQSGADNLQIDKESILQYQIKQ